jgi:DNA segregation ATPase FtsK/SpoIIIE-like protein
MKPRKVIEAPIEQHTSAADGSSGLRIIVEVLLDIRDLLQNPPIKISGQPIDEPRGAFSPRDDFLYGDLQTKDEQGYGTHEPPTVEHDHLFLDAVTIVREHKRASASLLQSKLGINYTQSAKLLDQLEAAGIIAPKEGAKPRKVL